MARMRSKRDSGSRVWQVAPVWPGRGALAAQLRMPEFVAQLLYNRGVDSAEASRRFLQPTLNDLLEPMALPGMAAAVSRIRQALGQGEKITLYGDYDVDGVTGVAILWRCLKLAGHEVEFYVPHRIEEGYGLNDQAIRQIAADGTKLIVTVDCGIGAFASVTLAAELGVEVVITDHHKLEGPLPPAVAIVHPDLPGGDYPNHYLCGAGVAFKLAWALAQNLSGAQKVSPEFREFLLAATCLAALGTVADVVPLVGENRVLTVFGLRGLGATEDPAIGALIAASGLNGSVVQSSDIGFRLAPRLNAAGRMGHARLAIELFTRASATRAKEIARYLEGQNQLRQKVENEIVTQAVEQVTLLGLDKPEWRGLVLAAESWHAGVVGIVASRLVDRFRRPTVVLTIQGTTATGSCRSIAGFDICRALEHCREHLTTFGGHAMAAGLSLDISQIDAFRQRFNEYAVGNLQEGDLVSKLDIDAEVSLRELDLATMDTIRQLEPFGQGNPAVTLLARNLRLAGPPRKVGKTGEHLQFTVMAADDPSALSRPGGVLQVVGFSKAKWEKKLLDAKPFDLVFEPSLNTFNGNTTVQLIADDIAFPD